MLYVCVCRYTAYSRSPPLLIGRREETRRTCRRTEGDITTRTKRRTGRRTRGVSSQIVISHRSSLRLLILCGKLNYQLESAALPGNFIYIAFWGEPPLSVTHPQRPSPPSLLVDLGVFSAYAPPPLRNQKVLHACGTVATESCNNGARKIVSCELFAWIRTTCDYICSMLTTACCLVVGLGLGLGLGLDLAIGWLVVIHK